MIAKHAILVLALLVSPLARLQAQLPAPISITHVTVIDTQHGRELPDRTVLLSGGRIAQIHKSSEPARLPLNTTTIDATGKFLIPGLWDMHVHGNNRPFFTSLFPLYLANGVTGIREMFGPENASEFREMLEILNFDGPHIYLGSPVLDANPPVWKGSLLIMTPVQGRKAVEAMKHNGSDFIKVYDRLSRESYLAIMKEARREKIPVAGHVPLQISAWEASAAKQVTLEHLQGIALACSTREQELWERTKVATSQQQIMGLELQAWQSYSAAKCQRLFSSFKKNGTFIDPTYVTNRAYSLLNEPSFTNDGRLRYFGGEIQRWLEASNYTRNSTDADFAVARAMLPYYQKLIGDLARAGVLLLAGTDTGNPYCFPGFSLHDELAALVQSGVSPAGALKAATYNAAKVMGSEHKYGGIKIGFAADLVLLNADPLLDIHNTTQIRAVFLGGKQFNRSAVDQMLRDAEALAKQPLPKLPD